MSDAPATLVIQPGRSVRGYFRELWQFRELLGFLAWRDIKVRYKQTVIGVTWALVQPLVTLVIFTFIFGRLAGMPSGGVPYPVLVMAGLLPWQLFSSAFSNASNSLVANTHLISKVYFPRLIIPMAAMAVAIIDFLVVFGLNAGVMIIYGVQPGPQIVFLPVFIFLALFLAFGAGLWMTALTVRYRDFRYVVPFLLQAGLFLSPVGYSTANMPTWRSLFSLNPLVGVIDGFRWSLLGDEASFYPPALVYSVVVGSVFVGTGLWFFRRTERTFADVI